MILLALNMKEKLIIWDYPDKLIHFCKNHSTNNSYIKYYFLCYCDDI